MYFLVFLLFSLSFCLDKHMKFVNETTLNEEEKIDFMYSIGLSDIYVINLERRTDRMQIMKQQLDILNLPFTRFSAIDGVLIKASIIDHAETDIKFHPETMIRFDWIEKQLLSIKKNVMSYGSIGCWQSHLQIYFKIRDKAEKTGIDGPVLILEDDALVDKKLPNSIKEYLKLLPHD